MHANQPEIAERWERYHAKFETTPETGLDEMHPATVDKIQHEESTRQSIDAKTGAPAFMSGKKEPKLGVVNGERGPRLFARRSLFAIGDPSEDRPVLMEPGGHVSATRPAGTEPVSPPAAKMARVVSMRELAERLDGDDAGENGDHGDHDGGWARVEDLWGDEALAVKGRFETPGELLRKAANMSRLPQVTPIGGSAPREETPALPDFQEIYYQPEDDERRKLEREQAETRRLADAARNTARYGIHGIAATPSTPQIRWEPEADPAEHTGPKLVNREPTVRADVDMDRIYAGSVYLRDAASEESDTEDDEDDDDDEQAEKALRVISPRELLRKSRT